MGAILGYRVQTGLDGRPPQRRARLDARGVLVIGVEHSRQIPEGCLEAAFAVDGKDEEIKIVFLPTGGTHSVTRHRGQIKLMLRGALQRNWPELLGGFHCLEVEVACVPGHPDWRTATLRRAACKG